MWQNLLRWMQQLLLAGHELERNRAEIKDLRRQTDELTSMMQQVLHEFQRLRENEAHHRQHETDEREKLMLRLENELLRFERRLSLPPARDERLSERSSERPTDHD